MSSLKLAPTFWRTASPLALSIGLLLATNPAHAQDTPPVSAAAPLDPVTAAAPQDVPAPVAADAADADIVVTGIRRSLERSMDIKRNSYGVVDAISAEDIGKMPDSNLAESLQRVTGISIDRVDGEGSKVTARGFGGDFNMVTLNGRQMPAADAFGAAGGSGRAFNFANLASEAVSGVEVYKTGRASIASGGIGATINIKTTRPLSTPGLKFNVGAKAVHDTTNRIGNDVTPELSGIFSWTDDDRRFGIAVTGSYQRRDSGSIYSYVGDWIIRNWVPLGQPGALDYFGSEPIKNAPAVGQLYGVPNSTGVNFTDRKRERINGQMTLQFKPIETLTLTGDYTYAENHIIEQRGGLSLYFFQTPDKLEFDTGNDVATTTLYSENLNGATKDVSFGGGYTNQTNTLHSAGFNAQWEASDRLVFTLDAHKSSMNSKPTGPDGIGDLTFAFGAPIVAGQTVTYGTSGAPNMSYIINDRLGNGNNLLDKADIGSQVSQTNTHSQKTDIDEYRFGGAYALDAGRIEFGVEHRKLKMVERFADTYNAMGDWGIANPGDVPADLYELIGIDNLWQDYKPNITPNLTARGDMLALTRWGAEAYGFNPGFGPDTRYSQNHRVQEDTTGAYVQLSLKNTLGGIPVNAVAGLRYEKTDVTSTSVLLQPSEIRWLQDNDFRIFYATGETPVTQKASYHYFLPNVDISFNLRDDLVTRLSVSKTIARANYNSLRATSSVDAPNGPSLLGNIATASANNPALRPLESKNIDASIEWYFNRSSYLSAGFFFKRVNNFLGTEQVDEAQFGLRDVTAGPRAEAARAALVARGLQVNQVSLFVMTAVLDNPAAFPGGAASFPLTTEGQSAVQALYDISPNANDPLFSFRTSKPVNSKSADIYGFEIGGQYFLGDSGVGVQANLTIVRSNVNFDNAAPTTLSQFALVGLSDSANAALIYEKHGLSARLAYNWRDKFLSNTSAGAYRSPEYSGTYSQLDLNISYDVTKQVAVAFEGINLTGSDLRTYGRTERQMWRANDFGPRYMVGIRYNM